MDRFDDDNLRAELREVRPEPRPEFATELDERAAAGFPRRETPSATAIPFALLADRWRAMSPIRRLMPVFAVALTAVVVATAVVAIAQSGGGSSSNPAEEALLGAVSGSRSAPEISGPEESGGAPHTVNPPAHHSSGNHGGGQKSAHHESSELTYEVEVPSVESKPYGAEKGPATPAGGGGKPAETGASEESGSAGESADSNGEEVEPFVEDVPPVSNAAGGATGRRDIERSSYVVLGTKSGAVAAAAAKVFQAVHAADGVVLNSSVQSGKKGATGAYFELLIPSRKLGGALAAFSSIAEVRERHDRTADITEPTVGKAEELADSNAAIEGLLKELAGVETEAERESVEVRLREERRRHAAIRGSLDHLHERVAMSEVTVRIVSGGGAGVTPAGSDSDSDSWGVGDALHDAGHILTIAAGVVLIGLAVLAPIALLALLLWAGNRIRVRRLRERTLG